MRKNCIVCGSLNRSDSHRMRCLKGTKFIRTVRKSCASQLVQRLPARFAMNVGEFLENRALVYGPGIDIWRVQFIRRNGGFTFGTGWKDFYEAYKVSKGCVLLFKYPGYSGFKVEVFDGRTGKVPVGNSSSGNNISGSGPSAKEEGKGPEGENKDVARKVGRPPIVYKESEEVGVVELYGMKLRQFTIYNLRGELRLRGLSVDGCKAELIERLEKFILKHGIKTEPEWQ